MATDTPRIPEQGVATLPDEAWERARRRAEIISPLAQSETVGHEAADMAAQALGLSRRQVYVLIRRARQGSGQYPRMRRPPEFQRAKVRFGRSAFHLAPIGSGMPAGGVQETVRQALLIG